jgi:spore coat protein U-like protein
MMCRFVRRLAFTLAAAVSLPATAVAGTCSSVRVAPLNFGSIVPGRFVKTINSVTTISVKCSRGTRFVLLLNDGSQPSGNSAKGRLSFPGTTERLTYDLFQDGSRTTLWGDGTNGAGITGFGDGAVQQFLVYAQLYVPPTAAIGSHSDSLTVTVSLF